MGEMWTLKQWGQAALVRAESLPAWATDPRLGVLGALKTEWKSPLNSCKVNGERWGFKQKVMCAKELNPWGRRWEENAIHRQRLGKEFNEDGSHSLLGKPSQKNDSKLKACSIRLLELRDERSLVWGLWGEVAQWMVPQPLVCMNSFWLLLDSKASLSPIFEFRNKKSKLNDAQYFLHLRELNRVERSSKLELSLFLKAWWGFGPKSIFL